MQGNNTIDSRKPGYIQSAKLLVVLFVVWFAIAAVLYAICYGYDDTMHFIIEVIGVCLTCTIIYTTYVSYRHIIKHDYFLFVATSLAIVVVLQLFNLAYGPYMYGQGFYYQRIELASRFMLASIMLSAPFVYNPTMLRRPVLMMYLVSVVFVLSYVLFGKKLLPLQLLHDDSYKTLAEITQYVLAVLFATAAGFHYAKQRDEKLTCCFFIIVACMSWSIHALVNGILMSTQHTRFLINNSYSIYVFGFICLHAGTIRCQVAAPIDKLHGRLKESVRDFNTLLHTLPDYIFKIDTNGKILVCNHAMQCFCLMDDVPLVGRNIKTIYPKQIGQHIMAVVGEIMKDGEPKEEYITYQSEREYVCLKLRVILEVDKKQSNDPIYLCSLVNVTPMNGREHQLISGHFDDLTEIYNLQGLKCAVKDRKEERMFILMGDIDGIKPINDTFGRHTGDQMIKVVADEMKRSLMPNWLIGRTSGDGFTIVMPGASLSQLEYYKQAVTHALRERPVGEGKIKPLVTFGSAMISDGSRGFEDGWQQARADVYKNKIHSRVTSTGSLIRGISQMLDEHGSETLDHCRRVSDILHKMAERMDLRETDLELLELLAYTHDIGKITIPRHILNKEAPLSDEEWVLIRSHPEAGSRIAASSSELVPVANLIIHHHEYWDGSGYPRGVKGRSIPLLSRMLQVADAYDVMTHDQCYRKALSKEKARREIQQNMGKQFDPYCAEIVLQVIKDDAPI